MRSKLLTALATVLLSSAAVPAALASGSKPVIKGEEAGYFGSATVTHRLSVFVYANLAPRAGMHVTVCVAGRCQRMVGHRNPAPWYSASFATRGLRMGASVRFTVVASSPAGHARVTVTRPLLCMHNNGSTPQS